MGSDNLHHKRKARSHRDLKRNKQQRAPYARVLIVCEGEKTEPNYLNALVADLELNPKNIVIEKNSDSSPISILNYTKQQYKKELQTGEFDKVFFVFDKDQHQSYISVVNQIQTKKKFEAITSIPCFEYWILLHFEYTTAQYLSAKSIMNALKKHLPNYSKNQNVYHKVKHFIQVAIRNAKKADAEAEKTKTDNPTTKMYKLVEYLYGLNSP